MKEGPLGRVQVLEGPATKRAALYLRISTADQSPEMQRYDLERLAAQRGLAIVETYVDQASGAKARRPGLERMMADARHAKFDVVLTWACDRLARSTSHFLQTLDELGHLGVEFASFREALDTSGALGRAVVTIIAVVSELERSLIRERVKGGLRAGSAGRQTPGAAPDGHRPRTADEGQGPRGQLDRPRRLLPYQPRLGQQGPESGEGV